MTISLKLNGFGRIGRRVTRALFESGRTDLVITGINNLGSIEQAARLLRRDSVHQKFNFLVEVDGNFLVIDGQKIPYVSTLVPFWSEGDIVLDCTGAFLKDGKARQHIQRGASKVLLSAPSPDAEGTIVYGVNHANINGEWKIVSNGSCTTNCLAPVLHALMKRFVFVRGWCTTTHAATAGNNTVDMDGKNPYMERAIFDNFIPTTTGAASAIFQVMEKMEIDAAAVRAPISDGSMIDLVFNVSEPTTVEAVNEALREAANGPLSKVLSIDDDFPTSRLVIGETASSIIDPNQTRVIDGVLVRVLSHYDNETGFSYRMLDTAAEMGKSL